MIWASAPPVSAQPPSLAELAQREEARRKAIKKPSKVFTNADLGKVRTNAVVRDARPKPEAATEAESAKPTAAKAPDKVPQPAEAEPIKDEAYWRTRITNARTQLDRTRLLLDALHSKVNTLVTDFAGRDDPAQRAVLAVERQKNLAEIERLQAEIATLEKSISDIEEEARRANVPPGWLR